MSNKISDIFALAEKLKSVRGEGKKIVLCHGCFDLLHIGHIRYLQQAKRMGDVLAVTITPDRFVDKGPGHPAFSESLRAESVASLGDIDFVALNEWATAVETLKLLRPDVYVKGSDFKSVDADITGKLSDEANVCEELGIELRFTDDVVFSSTNLINRFFSSFPDEVQSYLEIFRTRYSLPQVLECIDKMRELRVLLVGDTIIDEYCYGQTLGVSSKYPTIAMLQTNTDRFVGGALAIANHLANFCERVELFSVLGERESHEEFIKNSLLPNVAPHFFMQHDAPTTLKRRFIEGYTFAKLLEIYEMNDTGLDVENEQIMRDEIVKMFKGADMALVSDFGHGAISAKLRTALCASNAFLAVNTQLNAGNKGMNTISKYDRADYVSLSGGELLLDVREPGANTRELVAKAARKHRSQLFVSTLGRSGACGATEHGNYVEMPAFVSRAVDAVGSGDAFLAISSMGVRLGIPNEISIFLGNAAGGLAAQTLGNQEPISRQALTKFVTSLLK